MGKGDFERERREFIESGSKPYHPYAWELDGHPAMRRPPGRRLRHPWRQTRADWIKAVVFPGVVVGVLVLAIWIASIVQG
ncbi:MAG TPA: hypothetical protein VGB83_09870 [Actinomycetota bacterium]